MATRKPRTGPRERDTTRPAGLPTRLYRARVAAALTQAEAAAEIGVGMATVERWETGRAVPRSAPVLRAIEAFIAAHPPKPRRR